MFHYAPTVYTEARRTAPKVSPPQFRVWLGLGSVRVRLGLGADEKWGGESVTRVYYETLNFTEAHLLT